MKPLSLHWPFFRTGYLRVLIIIFLAFIIQMTVIPAFRIGIVYPNLILMCIVYFGIYYGATRGCFIGFVTGLCMDAITSTQLGPYIIIYILCGGLAGLLVKKVYRQHFLTFLASVAIGTLIESVILFFWNDHIGIWVYLFQLAGGSFLYNAVVAIPFSFVLNQLFNPDTVKFAILKTQRS